MGRAKEEPFFDNDRIYEYSSGTITAYKGDAAHLVIPKKLPCKDSGSECGFVLLHLFERPEYIGEGAFADNGKLVSVVIPGTVRQIRSGAFRNCRRLECVVLHEGLETIEDGAFFGCDDLLSVTIPGSVFRIGEKAFGYGRGRPSKTAKDFVVYGVVGSEAERYARENGFIFLEAD